MIREKEKKKSELSDDVQAQSPRTSGEPLVTVVIDIYPDPVSILVAKECTPAVPSSVYPQLYGCDAYRGEGLVARKK